MSLEQPLGKAHSDDLQHVAAGKHQRQGKKTGDVISSVWKSGNLFGNA